MKKRSKIRLGMGRRAFLKITGAGALGLAMGGIPFRTSAQPKEILVGDIHPTSGAQAEYGKACQDGTGLAVEHINAGGGIKSLRGAKLKLILADSEGKPEVGMRAAEKLIQQGVVGIIGAYQSNVTFVITQIGEKYHIPTIIDFGIADDILARGFKYCFRLMPSTDMGSEQGVTFLTEIAKYKNISLKTVVIIHENTLFGTSLSKKLIKYIEKAGMEIISVIPYPYNTADLSSEVAKIKMLHPDGILPISYSPDAILLTKTLAINKVYAKAYFGLLSAGHGSLGYVKGLGKMAEYNMDQTPFANPRSPEFAPFVADFKRRFGKDPDIVPAGVNYSAGLLLAHAIERAGSADPGAIRDALAKSSFKDHLLCGGPISFDEVGQNKNVVAPIIQVFQGEQYVVWPKRFAQKELVFPMPSWDEILK